MAWPPHRLSLGHKEGILTQVTTGTNPGNIPSEKKPLTGDRRQQTGRSPVCGVQNRQIHRQQRADSGPPGCGRERGVTSSGVQDAHHGVTKELWEQALSVQQTSPDRAL